jgi:hypothetical protein
VEFFFQELENSKRFDLYRFEKGMMDDDAVERMQLASVPAEESSEQLVLSRFSESRSITVPEHVFSRTAFNRENGFVDFPLAWCADDATWAAFARITGVRTIRNCRVLWRTGEFNLSAPGRQIALKIEGFALYLKWLQINFPSAGFQSSLKAATRESFPIIFSCQGKYVPLRSVLRFWLSYRQFTGLREWKMLLRLLKINSAAGYHWRRLKRFGRRHLQARGGVWLKAARLRK